MKLGKHAPSLEKSLTIVQKFNTIQKQINNESDIKKLEHLRNQTHYTSYAVALQVCLDNGYKWTALTGDK